jgi:hypothetical protein
MREVRKAKSHHFSCNYLRHNGPHPELASARVDPTSLPGVMMRIYAGDGATKQLPENIKIGDPLSMIINIDQQEKYGITISDCMVRDGLKWGEQRLLDKQG